MKGNGWKRKNLKIDFWCNGHTIGWFMVSLCFMVFSAYPIFGKIQEEMPLVPGQPVEARGFFPAWKLVKCVMHWWWGPTLVFVDAFFWKFCRKQFFPKKTYVSPKMLRIRWVFSVKLFWELCRSIFEVRRSDVLVCLTPIISGTELGYGQDFYCTSTVLFSEKCHLLYQNLVTFRTLPCDPKPSVNPNVVVPGGSIVPDRDPSIDDVIPSDNRSLGMTRIRTIQSHEKRAWSEN